MLTDQERIIKRIFDIVLSLAGLFITTPLILLAWIIASIETRSNGLFTQVRIGKDGKPFVVYKIKTMKPQKVVRLQRHMIAA